MRIEPLELKLTYDERHYEEKAVLKTTERYPRFRASTPQLFKKSLPTSFTPSSQKTTTFTPLFQRSPLDDPLAQEHRLYRSLRSQPNHV